MIRLAIILAAMTLAGCGDEWRSINPGAEWQIYIVSSEQFARQYPCMDGSAVCDYDRKRLVYANKDTPAVREAIRQTIHEPAHLYERRFPHIWGMVEAFESPGFNVTGHGTVAIPPPRLIK